MLHVRGTHHAHGFSRERRVVDAASAPQGFCLFLLPSVDTTETAVIVVAETPEVVERDHFQFEERQARCELLANRVESANARLFFDTLGQEFLGPRGAFLRRRLIARLLRVRNTSRRGKREALFPPAVRR